MLKDSYFFELQRQSMLEAMANNSQSMSEQELKRPPKAQRLGVGMGDDSDDSWESWDGMEFSWSSAKF